MKFRSQYTAEPAGFVLNPEKPAVLLGSCFADNIAERMELSRWKARNPFGVLFNPLSIARAVTLAISTENPASAVKKSIFEHEGIYHSWLFDSGKSARTAEAAEERAMEGIRVFREMIASAEALFITFGTSWCYFLACVENSSGREGEYVVANCHKQPQRLFTRRKIGIEEITEVWSGVLESLHRANPDLKVIFTVSPVRHLKDGFVENSRSKATLILAVERLCSTFTFCHYFPAYEIVNDDLRDYRFYASDLAHPSEMAVDYIWEIFQETYLDAEGCRKVREGEKAVRRERHRTIIN